MRVTQGDENTWIFTLNRQPLAFPTNRLYISASSFKNTLILLQEKDKTVLHPRLNFLIAGLQKRPFSFSLLPAFNNGYIMQCFQEQALQVQVTGCARQANNLLIIA